MKAITAEFEGIRTEGDDETFAFYFTLENHTSKDYKKNQWVCVEELPKPNSLLDDTATEARTPGPSKM